MRRGQLVLLLGQIASGKSTLAQLTAAQGAVLVNDDALVAAMHGGKDTRYEKRLKPVYKAAENAIVQTALMLGRTVVIDRPNASRGTRARYIGLGKALDCRVVGIRFPLWPAEVHARRRYEADSRGRTFRAWVRAAERVHKAWSEPELVEGFDQVLYAGDTALSAEEILDRLKLNRKRVE